MQTILLEVHIGEYEGYWLSATLHFKNQFFTIKDVQNHKPDGQISKGTSYRGTFGIDKVRSNLEIVKVVLQTDSFCRVNRMRYSNTAQNTWNNA